MFMEVYLRKTLEDICLEDLWNFKKIYGTSRSQRAVQDFISKEKAHMAAVEDRGTDSGKKSEKTRPAQIDATALFARN